MSLVGSNHSAFMLLVEENLHVRRMFLFRILLFLIIWKVKNRKRKSISRPYGMLPKIPSQVSHMNRLIGLSDRDCVVNLRMDRNAFGRLCLILKDMGGLEDGRYVSVEEQVAMFLCVLAHHKKISVVGFDFQRSGQTISHYIHLVLHAVIKLYALFLSKPPPVDDTCIDPRWTHFKGCLGALDGTFLSVHVRDKDKPRYRNRKGQVCTNTLAACDRDLRFVYILPGWEGSAADGRVLRHAVTKPNCFKVPKGVYYLCDNGYANSEGFLTPYKGVRYHLKEWGPQATIPQNPQELFNMRHTKARNIIERAFGVLKMRWGILRSPSFYHIKVQTRLILACFLMHNFIRGEMVIDPIEEQLVNSLDIDVDEVDDPTGYVDYVESTPAWNAKRDSIAQLMWANR